MAGSAAHLVDRVLPSVPLRQYVLAFPYELSGLAATRPEVLAALSRIFWESLRLHYQKWAKAAGHATSGRVERRDPSALQWTLGRRPLLRPCLRVRGSREIRDARLSRFSPRPIRRGARPPSQRKRRLVPREVGIRLDIALPPKRVRGEHAYGNEIA